MKPRKCLANKKENWVRIPSELGRGIQQKETVKSLPSACAQNSKPVTLHEEQKYIARGQFNKTFASVIYKCSYCFETLKQWLHL